VTTVAVTALVRLTAADCEAAWDDYVVARARLDGILAGESRRDGTCLYESLRARQCMDRLLDGGPAPDMTVPRQPWWPAGHCPGTA
jgi:hypothetical protein